MSNSIVTPFSEYREEQIKVNMFDYFVEPSFFDVFCDTKPIIISGSRGTGKTTLLKALAVSETKDIKQYLNKNEYIGIYYRVDLNITTAFRGGNIQESDWEKLFSYYFVSKLSYEFISQLIQFNDGIAEKEENRICSKYGMLFSNRRDICSFEELRELIYQELHTIIDFINNCAYTEYPHIGNYAEIIRGLPRDVLLGMPSYNCPDKSIFYLIDEFEGLFDWQQKIILSFVKYSDRNHTYKICMRPDGIKTAQTRGSEYVRETDDVRTIDLNELILDNREDYYKYALDVCSKRFKLYYDRQSLNLSENIPFDDIFDELTEDQEFEMIFNENAEELNSDMRDFFENNGIQNPDITDFFRNNYYDFLIYKLMYYKNKNRMTFEDIYSCVRNKTSKYVNAEKNYKSALLYQLCLKFSKKKNYSGFKTLVNISGGTLRYLLELCNEIFERAVATESFDYKKIRRISSKIQTDAVHIVSHKRVRQISAIPEIGWNMRMFVFSLGAIYQLFHKDERISKFETNHFSIKPSSTGYNENVQSFLRECVMRGVLLKGKNNKIKTNYLVSYDEYIYKLHPIYTPTFHISWRNKQKAEFTLEEIETLISADTKSINKLIRHYEEKYLSKNDRRDTCFQIEMFFDEDEQ